jgi:hypothetical protein
MKVEELIWEVAKTYNNSPLSSLMPSYSRQSRDNHVKQSGSRGPSQVMASFLLSSQRFCFITLLSLMSFRFSLLLYSIPFHFSRYCFSFGQSLSIYRDHRTKTFLIFNPGTAKA